MYFLNKRITCYPSSDKLPYEKRGEEIRCIDDEIPFDIPDSWAWCRLGEIVAFRIGKTPPRKDPLYWDNPIYPWVSIADMKADSVIYETNEQINEFAYSNVFSRRISYKGTLLMSFKLTVGRVSILGIDAFHNEAIVSIFPYIAEEGITKWYLFKVLPLITKWGNSKDAIKGTTLNSDSLYNLLIPLPPLNEQKRIVEKIEELLPYVEAYRKCETELTALNKNFPDALKKSILQWAVQGKLVDQDPNDEPADILLAKIRAEKEKLIKEGKIKRDKNASKIIRRGNEFYEKHADGSETQLTDLPFDLPASWTWCRLGELCSYIQRGKSPIYSLKKEIPVISQKCIQWDGVSLKNAKFIDPLSVYKYNEERFLKSGDLLWNSTGLGTVGRVGVYYTSSFNRIVVDSHVTIARILSKFINIYYVYSWFSSPEIQSDIEEKADGSTKQKELNLNTIKNFYVPFPPVEEQVRISRQIKILLSIIESG